RSFSAIGVCPDKFVPGQRTQKENAVNRVSVCNFRRRNRRRSFANVFETLEVRQLMSGTIDFLNTDGPAAHTGDDPRAVVTTDLNGDGKIDLVTGNAQG